MQRVIENGQLLWWLSVAEWQAVLQQGHFQGRPVSATCQAAVRRVLPYVARYPELQLYLLDLDGRFFFPRTILYLALTTQRVWLEELTCATCNWRGMSAEPFTLENYLGLAPAVIQQLMQRAGLLPVWPCPRCGAKLPRRAVWTAY